MFNIQIRTLRKKANSGCYFLLKNANHRDERLFPGDGFTVRLCRVYILISLLLIEMNKYRVYTLMEILI